MRQMAQMTQMASTFISTHKSILLAGFVFAAATFLYFVFDRKRRYPEKSYKNCIINIILTPIRAMRLGPYKAGALTLDSALKYAMKKSKLTDFGDKGFMDTYTAIMTTPTHLAQRYTNLGYVSARIELNMTLVSLLVVFCLFCLFLV